jgi:peptidyl-prolyl cis-trans isomerase C
MKTSWSALGFVAVAAAIGLLEWQSSQGTQDNELVVSESQRAFLREQVLQAGSAGPGAGNYEQALANYIDEEILYREGLKLGLEKDDLIVKRRVVQKMRFLLEDMTPIAPPTAEQLQTWLDQNPQKYQTDQTIVFEHHFFSRGKRGDEAVYQAGVARDALLKGQTAGSDPFPLQLGVLVTREGVAREIGLQATNTLFELPIGEWSQPVLSALGVHLFKVQQRNPGRTMTLEEAGSQLRSDLVAAQREEVNEAGLAALRSTYTIREVQ